MEKKNCNKTSKNHISCFLFYFVFSNPVYAYIDPGMGTYILLLFLAGFLGAVLAVKIFWKKLRIQLISRVILPTKRTRILSNCKNTERTLYLMEKRRDKK